MLLKITTFIKCFLRQINFSNQKYHHRNCYECYDIIKETSTRYTKISISTSYYSCKPACPSQDHPTRDPIFTFNINFSKILCSLLDISMRNLKSLSNFLKSILQFIRPSPSSTYDCFNNTGTKYITRKQRGLSHYRDNKIKHGFRDSLNPICSCGLNIETTCHYILLCANFTNERSILLNIVSKINKNSLISCDATNVKLLLPGDESLDLVTNTLILNATFDFILSSKRFDGLLI